MNTLPGRTLLLAAVLAASAGCNLMPELFPGPTASPASPAPSVAASPPPSSAPTQRVETGVRGLVLAGPTCPVEQAGQSPCVRAVAGAVLLAFDASGAQAGRAVTNSAGVYFLPLPPGPYRIVPQPVAGLMGVAAPAEITVTAGQPVELNFQYDTGIR